jgi:tRNA(Ile)-lysidine synthase
MTPDSAGMRAAVAALIGEGAQARFGVAASGGPDSMALLDLMAAAFPGQVACATVDHGLRAASAQEAAMVADFCAGRGVPHAVLHPDAPPTGNVQDWARTQRYALLERWRAAQGVDWLLTAHHADDQLETVLMRLNRGAGVGGLAGVRARSGVVLRPLLGVRKAALAAYVEAAGIPYVQDPSNRDPRFDRARLRGHLAEADWLHPEAASRSAAALAQADVALDWVAAELARAHVRPVGEGWMLDRTDLPEELLRRMLLLLLAAAGIEEPRGSTTDRLIAAGRAGKRASIGAWTLAGGPQWRLTPAPPRRSGGRQHPADDPVE